MTALPTEPGFVLSADAFYERLGFRRLPDNLPLVQKAGPLAAAHDA